MEALLGLLLMLAVVSHGMETSCDATQDGAQCYGALGGTVYLQLVTDARGQEFKLLQNPDGKRTVILKIKNEEVVTEGPSAARLDFTINNGTLKITDTERNDSGEYSLDINDSEGSFLKSTILQLYIEAPVSSPRLSSECLSQGDVTVSCSSEGDGPQYSWTLPSTAVVLSGEETNNVTLKRGSSGDLTCTAKNNISSAAGHLNISPCPCLIYINCTLPNGTQISDCVNDTGNTLCLKPTTPTSQTKPLPTNHMLIVMVSLAAVIVFLLAIVGVYYVRKKRKKSASTTDNAEDVTYADIRFTKKGQERRKKKDPPPEVEYGQVKVSGSRRLQPSQATPPEVEYGQVTILPGSGRGVEKPEEDYVYSSVRIVQ